MLTQSENRMIAYCGLVCTDCDAYVATQAEDMEALTRIAKSASEQLGVEMMAADAMCDGCLSTTGRQIGYCHSCKIRQCAKAKHVENCAHCESYPCDTLSEFAAVGSPQRAVLEEIQKHLEIT